MLGVDAGLTKLDLGASKVIKRIQVLLKEYQKSFDNVLFLFAEPRDWALKISKDENLPMIVCNRFRMSDGIEKLFLDHRILIEKLKTHFAGLKALLPRFKPNGGLKLKQNAGLLDLSPDTKNWREAFIFIYSAVHLRAFVPFYKKALKLELLTPLQEQELLKLNEKCLFIEKEIEKHIAVNEGDFIAYYDTVECIVGEYPELGRFFRLPNKFEEAILNRMGFHGECDNPECKDRDQQLSAYINKACKATTSIPAHKWLQKTNFKFLSDSTFFSRHYFQPRLRQSKQLFQFPKETGMVMMLGLNQDSWDLEMVRKVVNEELGP